MSDFHKESQCSGKQTSFQHLLTVSSRYLQTIYYHHLHMLLYCNLHTFSITTYMPFPTTNYKQFSTTTYIQFPTTNSACITQAETIFSFLFPALQPRIFHNIPVNSEGISQDMKMRAGIAPVMVDRLDRRLLYWDFASAVASRTLVSYSYRSPSTIRMVLIRSEENARSPVCVSETFTPLSR